jgi:hypothetical protein
MKKISIFLFIVFLLLIFLYKYGFLIALFLFSPPLKTYTENENKFKDSLTKICNCKSVRIEPKHDLNDGNKYFGFVINGIQTNIDNRDSLNIKSFLILKNAYNIL